MQKSLSIDKDTIRKIGKGLLISLGGACLAGIVILIPEVNGWIESGDPINYRTALIAAFGAASTSLVNAGREFIKGV